MFNTENATCNTIFPAEPHRILINPQAISIERALKNYIFQIK